MVWFYSSSKGTVRVETRHDAVTSEYVLEIEWPGRPLAVERFRDVAPERPRRCREQLIAVTGGVIRPDRARGAAVRHHRHLGQLHLGQRQVGRDDDERGAAQRGIVDGTPSATGRADRALDDRDGV